MGVTWLHDKFAKIRLASGRNAIARRRLQRREPHPFAAECSGGFIVLVHRSTKRDGWWQATFLDRSGEPFGDSESPQWVALLEHIHLDGVRWGTVRGVETEAA
jgi:hypothetical protein